MLVQTVDDIKEDNVDIDSTKDDDLEEIDDEDKEVILVEEFVSESDDSDLEEGEVREDSTSRNKLLDNKNIRIAQKFTKKIIDVFKNIKRNTKKTYLLQNIKSNNNIKIEYLELRNKNNLSKKINKKNLKIFIAFYIQGIRLIDNF